MFAPSSVTPFAASYAPPDEDIAAQLLAMRPDAATRARAAEIARGLIAAVRTHGALAIGVEDFLREFSLSSHEGVAVMALAESLLRVTDDETLDRLIADKLAVGDFSHHAVAGSSLPIQACAFALGLSARLFGEDSSPHGLVEEVARRLGAPALRLAAKQAMRLVGAQFVFGETIEDALRRASHGRRGLRYSFDMLGEAARSAADAERYFDAYAGAIAAIGASAAGATPSERPGISVKLSALHPRYEAISRGRVLRELSPRLLELARRAKAQNLCFTVDAEEADRLELSLEVIASVLRDPSLEGWDGFGLAVQAYQKRALAVIDHVATWAEAWNRRLMVRLVKGAYWDGEIKRAQERGLDDYPVFTRKAMTDVSFLACAARLFAHPRLFPQFATHNAATVGAILARGAPLASFEFQRLHGMGDALYAAVLDRETAHVRVYAPVGPHRDLLAYLVRRLIENGANSSFVARAADPAVPETALLVDPYEAIGDAARARHPHLPRPRDMYLPQRAGSKGIDFGDSAGLAALRAEVEAARGRSAVAAPTMPSRAADRTIHSPIDNEIVGVVVGADAAGVESAMAAAQRAFAPWNATLVETRARMIERAAELIEARRGRLIALLQAEGGKTLDDALAEVREAADYCRYYAHMARDILREIALPGPTGEDNRLHYGGRGVFVCISPWNFPLAIFLGQIVAALVTGNAVVAKPAEQTPLVAAEAVAILREALGAAEPALQFVPGDGGVGAALVAHPFAAGVVFTGSVQVARQINRTLAAKDGAIVPLIAETGGINAGIVDSTALLEQVADDVCVSAFRSAGQRCSALRLLYVQKDVFDACVEMIVGAARELRVGDPREIATHIGPVIDEDAKAALDAYLARRRAEDCVIFSGVAPPGGCFVAPHIVRLERGAELQEEVFGPVLHVVPWRAEEFDDVLAEIAASGYGLTLGLHTRIESRAAQVAAAGLAGNTYVNRSVIGAVVGSQPFGGFGLSGTGPKAGGPDYLRRFLREYTVTANTAALGGDLRLLALEE
jgi:RHH-type proline utilization regulon transcriptional repressor/proline dehydrogenase/delta 1-pyrroline-5-carboxylate dehydrogenase